MREFLDHFIRTLKKLETQRRVANLGPQTFFCFHFFGGNRDGEGSVLHHEVHEPSRDDDLLHHGFALDVARGHGTGLFEELFPPASGSALKFLRSLPLI